MPKCLKYYVKLNENLAPIPGSQQGYSPDNLPCDAGCLYVQLQKTPYTAPAGKTQCFFPNGTRYFYQIYRKSGNIVPNSLRESLIFPTDLNSCQWVEYKKFC